MSVLDKTVSGEGGEWGMGNEVPNSPASRFSRVRKVPSQIASGSEHQSELAFESMTSTINKTDVLLVYDSFYKRLHWDFKGKFRPQGGRRLKIDVPTVLFHDDLIANR